MRPAATRIALLLLSISLAAGCVDDAPEIAIMGNKILPDDCTIDAGLATSNVSRTRGTLDVFLATTSRASTGGYVMIPAVLNTLIPARTVGVDGDAPGIDGLDWPGHTIEFRRAEIRYEFPEGFDVDIPLEVPDFRFVDTVEPGESAVVTIEVITREIADQLASSAFLQRPGAEFTMFVNLRLFGETFSRRSVASNTFTYPIRVCNGCLVSFPTAAIDPTAEVQPNCRNLEGFEEAGGACFPGQDEPVDCRAVCPFIVQAGLDSAGICEPRQ